MPDSDDFDYIVDLSDSGLHAELKFALKNGLTEREEVCWAEMDDRGLAPDFEERQLDFKPVWLFNLYDE